MTTLVESNQSDILNQLLLSDNEAVCCYAARAAGCMAAHNCTHTLMECLYHQDLDVIIDAITALGDIRAYMAIDILIDAVDLHPDGDVRVAAAQALAKMPNEKVLESAIRWAKKEPNEQRTEALWDDDWDIQLLAIETLGKSQHQPAIATLMTLIKQQNLDIEGQILKALTLIGPKGVSNVIALLSSAGDSEASASDIRIARRCATALAFATCSTSLEALASALLNQHASIRAGAVLALGKRQAQQYIIEILELLDDSDDGVKNNAIGAINNMQDLLNEDIELYVSSEYLLTLFPKTSTAGRIFIYKLLLTIAATLDLTNEQLAKVHSGLSSADANEQICASQLVSAINDHSAVNILIYTLLKQETSIRAKQAMLATLSDVSDNDIDTLKCLISTLEDPSSALRLNALQALVKLTKKTAVDAVFTAHHLMFDYIMSSRAISVDEIDRLKQQATDPQRIPLQAVDVNDQQEQTPTKEQVLTKEQQLQAILASVSDDYPDSDTSTAVPEFDTQADITSTLDSIQRETVTAFLSPKIETKDDTSAPHIRDMVEQLPETDQVFADIVVDHLNSGEKVKLSRKKIAKMPEYNNKLLMIKALANLPQEHTVDTLLQQFLFDDVDVQIEAVCSLTIIAQHNPQLKSLRKSLGPLCTLLLSGNDHLRLVCARAIGTMRHQASLPLLLDSLSDSDSNVRIQVIDSLSRYLSKENKRALKLEQTTRIMSAVYECLSDSSTGVIIKALAFLGDHKTYFGSDDQLIKLERIFEVGCTKDDFLSAAANTLHVISATESGNLLLQKLDTQTDEQIKIIILKMLAIVLKSDK